MHQATRGSPSAAFAFSTQLTDLRTAFRQSDTDQMLTMANYAIDDFAGGTRLGESLTELRTHRHRVLVGRRTVVLLITDGLDTGEPEAQDNELQSLKGHSLQLLWLNPLLRLMATSPWPAEPPCCTGTRTAHWPCTTSAAWKTWRVSWPH